MKNLLTGTAVAMLTAGIASAEGHLAFTPGEGDFNWDSLTAFGEANDLTGQTVTVFGPWRGDDQALVENVIAYFEDATGATVEYSSSENYEQQIVIDAEAGSPPDVAVLPQPGLIANLASRGFITPLGDETQTWLEENYAAGESWVSLGTYAGPDGEDRLYAFPYKIDVKSLVWYSPENFEDAGYEVPTSMEELKALTEQIVADGGTPWCIGLGSGGANDDFGAGGAGAVASTDFRDSPKGLFASPPQCYMHHQASFIPTFFPDGIELGLDADFFYMPSYAGKDLGNPVLGAGTLAFITKDGDGARAFLEFLKTPIAHEIWMAQSGFLTPFKSVNTANYANDTLKKQGDILLDATTFRFDASDLMPGAVGAGSFWTGMVDYAGGKDAAEVAAEIEQSWPAN